MKYFLILFLGLTFTFCGKKENSQLTIENIPRQWTMLQISNTDTLQYKDCLGTTIGIEVAKEKTSTKMIFKWSFETMTYLIKDIQLLTKDKYLINTDSGKITLILNDKNKLIATIYTEGQGEGNSRVYIDSRNANRYKPTDLTCDED